MVDEPVPIEDVLSERGQSLDGLLRLLEELDGTEEAQVVRSALEAGVPQVVVIQELQNEVERRLNRTRGFYEDS
jgi:hypothetical protein